MFGSTRRHLAVMATAGLVTVGTISFILITSRGWYTPIAEVLGFLAAIAFLWLGIRWTFSVLADVYGD